MGMENEPKIKDEEKLNKISITVCEKKGANKVSWLQVR